MHGQSNFGLLDREELAFREHLLDSIGKGRLTGQDAVFSAHHSSAPPGQGSFAAASGKRRSFAQVYDSRSSLAVPSASARARSNSVGAEVVFAPSSHPPQQRVQEQEKAVKKRFSVSRLLSKDKDSFPTVATGRRGSRAGAAGPTAATREDDGE